MNIFKGNHSVFVADEGLNEMLKVLNACKLNINYVRPEALDFQDGWRIGWKATTKEWKTIKAYIRYNLVLQANCVLPA